MTHADKIFKKCEDEFAELVKRVAGLEELLEQMGGGPGLRKMHGDLRTCLHELRNTQTVLLGILDLLQKFHEEKL